MITSLLHCISQYLAAANMSFNEPAPDDSHTNLGWLEGALHTYALGNKKVQLSFNYERFSLQIVGNNQIQELILDGQNHEDVLEWLTTTFKQVGLLETYSYEFHYDLPFKVTDFSPFIRPESKLLTKAADRRTKALNAIVEVLKNLKSEESIRVWPHHFDTGAYLTAPFNKELGIGLGLATPDSVCDEFYYYLGVYKGHDALLPEDAKELEFGHWSQKDFVGAVVKDSDVSMEQATGFFTEVFETYKEQFAT